MCSLWPSGAGNQRGSRRSRLFANTTPRTVFGPGWVPTGIGNHTAGSRSGTRPGQVQPRQGAAQGAVSLEEKRQRPDGVGGRKKSRVGGCSPPHPFGTGASGLSACLQESQCRKHTPPSEAGAWRMGGKWAQSWADPLKAHPSTSQMGSMVRREARSGSPKTGTLELFQLGGPPHPGMRSPSFSAQGSPNQPRRLDPGQRHLLACRGRPGCSPQAGGRLHCAPGTSRWRCCSGREAGAAASARGPSSQLCILHAEFCPQNWPTATHARVLRPPARVQRAQLSLLTPLSPCRGAGREGTALSSSQVGPFGVTLSASLGEGQPLHSVF